MSLDVLSPPFHPADPLSGSIEMDAATAKLFEGGGAMGLRMQQFDWSNHPLGPPQHWPRSLKTVVRIMLTSRFAMWMGWGPDLYFFYNDAYAPTLGIKQGSALGSLAAEVWKEIWDEVGPRTQSVITTGEATWDESLRLFLERKGFAEETYHTFSYSPIPDDDGTVGGMLCVVTEETERVLGNRRLNLLRDLSNDLAESKTETDLFKALPLAMARNARDFPFALVYLYEEDGKSARLVSAYGVEPGIAIAPWHLPMDGSHPWCDPTFIAGLSLVDDLGAKFDGLPAAPWDIPPRQAMGLPIVRHAQEAPAGFLVAGVNPYRPLDAPYYGFMELLAGQIAAALTNVRAYEEEREQAKRLAELDRAKTMFFSNVSHEFRTPLTLMLGPIDNALQEIGGEALSSVREDLEVARRNSLRLMKLVNTLLDFSRIEAGRVQASFEPVSLGALTADLASGFRSAIERGGLKLTVDCPDLPEDVFVDREMWEKVVLNLMSNAFKHTMQGEIAVSLRPVAGAVELSVTDTGVGIPAEALPHLFERFFRVTQTRAQARTHEGSGIGLALVQELVRLHGGSIEVQSTEGEGSRFAVRIPLGKDHLPVDRIAAPGKSGASAARAGFVEEALGWNRDDNHHAQPSFDSGFDDTIPQKRGRIVLADDNEDMREYVGRLLLPQYEIEMVPDGKAALDAVRRERPDLVLTDAMMPVLDGFALIKEIRNDTSLSDIPVIMLSARAGEESRIEGRDAGADDYLVKPFSARELLARVATTLSLATLRHENARRLTRILESITDAFVAIDKDWCFRYINRSYMDLVAPLYSSPGQLLGANVWEKFPDIEGTPVGNFYRQTMAEQKPGVFELFYQPLQRWLEIHAHPSPNMLSLNIRDVTERHEAEQALRVRSERMQLLSDSLGQLLGAHDTDAIVRDMFSRVAAHLDAEVYFNYMVDDVGNVLRLHSYSGIPADAAQVLSRMDYSKGICGMVAEQRAPCISDNLQVTDQQNPRMETRLGLKTYACHPLIVGDRLLGTLSFGSRTRPPFTEDEIAFIRTVTHSTGVALDRLRAGHALTDSEHRYRHLVNSMPLAVYTIDADGVLTLYNDAAAALWGQRPPLGAADWCSSFSAWRTDGSPINMENCPTTLALKGGETRRGEEIIIERPGGARRHVLVHPEPIRDARGNLIGALNVLVDITDRKDSEIVLQEAKEAAESASRSKDQFLAALSHELRTPLTPVLMLAAAYEEDPALPASVKGDMALIRRNVELETKLIDDLLDLSRIITGKLALRIESVDVDQLVREACGICRPQVLEKQLDLTISLDHRSSSVRADPARLQQVLWNLLHNAVKFTPERGSIDISTRHLDNGTVRIQVRDSGRGIPSELLPKLFNAFEQGDVRITRMFGGLGMGLAISRALVELHKGTIVAESAGPDRGALFTVTLPVETTRPRTPQQSTPEAPADVSKVRLLMVEDHADTARTLGILLRRAGFHIKHAGDVTTALRMLDEESFDVLVSDLGLPDGTGFELMRRVREHHDLPGIAMSGYGMEDDILKSREAGFSDHLIKPISLPKLQQAIRRVLGKT